MSGLPLIRDKVLKIRDVTELHLINPTGDVYISRTGGDKHVSVEGKGEEHDVAMLTLEITEDGKVFIRNETASQIPLHPTMRMTLNISVPPFLPIYVIDAKGKIDIGNVGGYLEIQAAGDCDIQAGHMTGLKVESADNAKIEVAGVYGKTATIVANGGSKVHVVCGLVDTLNITSNTNQYVSFGGTAQDATITLPDDYLGQVVIGRVTGTLTRDGAVDRIYIGGIRY